MFGQYLEGKAGLAVQVPHGGEIGGDKGQPYGGGDEIVVGQGKEVNDAAVFQAGVQRIERLPRGGGGVEAQHTIDSACQ